MKESTAYTLEKLFCFWGGFAFVMWMTSPNIGLHDDGFALLQPVLSGDPSNITSHFPPLYPWLLYFLSRFDLDWNMTARLINSISLPLIAILMAHHVCRNLTRFYRLFLVVGLVISYTSMFRHAWVNAEPLFHLTVVIFFLICLKYRQMSQGGVIWVALAGICAAIGFGFRYAGLALWPVAATLLVVVHYPRVGCWIRDILIFAVFSGIPSLLLLLWNQERTGAATNRDFMIIGIAPDRIAQFRITVLEFVLPFRLIDIFPAWMQWSLIVILFMMLMGGSLLTRHYYARAYVILWFFILSYLGVVTATILFADRTTPYDHRIMAPVFISLVGIVTYVSAGMERRWSELSMGKILIRSTLCIFLISSGYRGMQFARRANAEGLGHFSTAWQTSETWAYVEQVLPERTIYSNAARSFNFRLGGNDIRTLPYKESVHTGVRYGQYEESIMRMAMDMEKNGAVIVVSYLLHASDADFPPYLMTLAEIKSHLDIVVVTNMADGVVFGWRVTSE